MRFLGLLRADETSEAGLPPSPELIERCGAFVEQAMKAGVLVATDGLMPSKFGKRVRVTGGKARIIDGPFTESKELVASYAVLEAPSIDEAVDWTRRFLEAIGGGECEIRPIYGPEHCAPECGGPGAAEPAQACESARRTAAGG